MDTFTKKFSFGQKPGSVRCNEAFEYALKCWYYPEKKPADRLAAFVWLLEMMLSICNSQCLLSLCILVGEFEESLKNAASGSKRRTDNVWHVVTWWFELQGFRRQPTRRTTRRIRKLTKLISDFNAFQWLRKISNSDENFFWLIKTSSFPAQARSMNGWQSLSWKPLTKGASVYLRFLLLYAKWLRSAALMMLFFYH